jgi:carbonic anhydrase/acetyltransferase-like protein (isoleucine patch superfamily)
MIYGWQGKKPNIDKAAFIAKSADIIGDVTLGEDSTIWFNTTLRGDIAPVIVGKGSNIQDGAILHINHKEPCVVGDYVTVGHGAILHSTNVGNGSLIGMGAILLNNSKIGENSVVGAGALVTENKEFPPRSLIVGSPARKIKELTDDDLKKIEKGVQEYINLGKEMAKESREKN